MSNNLYFCGVKSVLRLKVAALKQRFLWSNFLVKLDTERIKECGNSNARKVIAEQYLTAPCALFCLMS